MAKYEYSRPQATAFRMIERFGKSITLTEPINVPDPADPLGAPIGDDITYDAVAVFVQPSSQQRLGASASFINVAADAELTCIAAPVDVEDNLSACQFMDDGNGEWKISHIEVLKPADDIVLYYLAFNRP